jgi:hypothetical protein
MHLGSGPRTKSLDCVGLGFLMFPCSFCVRWWFVTSPNSLNCPGSVQEKSVGVLNLWIRL